MAKLRVYRADLSSPVAAPPKLRVYSSTLSGSSGSTVPKLRVYGSTVSGTVAGTPRLRVFRAELSGAVNTAPTCSLTPTDATGAAGARINLHATASDADSPVNANGLQDLTYAWSIGPNTTGATAVLTPTGADAVLTCPISLGGGSVTVQCAATDATSLTSPVASVVVTVLPAVRRLRVGGVVIPAVTFVDPTRT